MRSLFFKIFACFWLSHLIVVSLLFALLTGTQGSRDRLGDNRRDSPPTVVSGTALAAHARSAAAQAGNASALELYLRKIEKETGLRASLLGPNGKPLSGGAPREAGDLARRAAHSGETEFAQGRSGLVVAHRAIASSGMTYVLILAPQRPRGPEGRGRFPASPTTSLFGIPLDRRQAFEIARLFSVFIAAGIVAFGLARYLTSPTVKLRRATQQLASGDLSARVGPQMGRRRDELAELGRDFDRMAERIQSLLVSERRLLGDISHELGSPLARLNVALELAEQGADVDTRKYLSRINRESQRLDALIGQLLTLTRLEAGERGTPARPSSDFSTVNLAQLVDEVCADADFEARGRGRKVRLMQNETCYLEGNAELLRSAIENVVRNAVLHTPEGTEIEVSLRMAAPGELEGADDNMYAQVTVRDRGPGVPPEALSELFRPFYRVAEARDRQSGGVGLGLSITERAVRFHGGTVKAANAPDGGLQVEILVPARRHE